MESSALNNYTKFAKLFRVETYVCFNNNSKLFAKRKLLPIKTDDNCQFYSAQSTRKFSKNERCYAENMKLVLV